MTGKVTLVGAGPGDEGLITVKGLKRLEAADVVIYDYLANPRLLKNCSKACETIYVGKKAGHHTLGQEEISKLVYEKAKAGKNVVRLKGGDPYVFGRGGEEGEYLYQKGMDFEVIPGISSAVGGLAYAGIPVTYREIATSFHVMTGHLSKDDKEINYKALAALEGTLVFLMGIGNIDQITKRLMEEGKSPNTPAAIVYQASTSKQQVEVGRLDDIAKKQQSGEKKPGIIVIGEVVLKRPMLDFFSKKPLVGQKIIVTRATNQNASLVERLNFLGGDVHELPTIEIQAISEATLMSKIERLKNNTHLVFTSQNAVEIFFETLLKMGHDARQLSHLKITVVGQVTKKALKKYFINADYMAKSYHSESLIAVLKEQLKPDDQVFMPRSQKGNSYLVDALLKICQVDALPIYDTVPVAISKEQMEQTLEQAKWLLFTSASTVEYFFEPLIQHKLQVPQELKILSIGPMTSEKLRYYGYAQHLEAQSHTIEGMIETLLENSRKGE